MKNVHRLSRRSLLGTSAVIGSAGLILAACGQVQTTAAPMEQAAEAPKEEAKQQMVVEHKPVVALLISQRESTIARRRPRWSCSIRTIRRSMLPGSWATRRENCRRSWQPAPRRTSAGGA